MKRTEQIRGHVIRIDVLPDDILLQIFDFYFPKHPIFFPSKRDVEAWQSLVHICRRWRGVVFQSPRRLNLQLFCTPERSAKYTLDIWPALPLIVRGNMARSSSTDNIVAALGHSNRVCHVDLSLAGWQLDKVLGAMQVPFPERTFIYLSSYGEMMPVLPDSFLGGSAPCLRFFALSGIPFPGLPKILLSATHLVFLRLTDIPHSGYISPEEMVSLISVLSSLRTLTLGLQSPESHPGWESRSLPPQKRTILPSLNRLFLKGTTEYLEEFVTRIDTPRLYVMDLSFLNPIDFDCPRLAQFINHTPELTRALDKAFVYFNYSTAGIALQHHRTSTDKLDISVSCRKPDRQLSSIDYICNSSLHPLSTVEALYIERDGQLVWMKDAIETTLWLQLLLPFTAVKNLYLSEEFAPGIAASLQEHAGGRITEVLPSLQNIFVQELKPSGSFQEHIAQFVDARRLSGRPVNIFDWDIDA